MPTKLPPKLKKKLQKLHNSRYTCSIENCTSLPKGKWKGARVCSFHYRNCERKYLQSWVVFIAQITHEVIYKMTFTKDERCLIDPQSCFRGESFDTVTLQITDYIIKNYIPDWARSVLSVTLIKKGVKKGLKPLKKYLGLV
jgi:hypothetical protein